MIRQGLAFDQWLALSLVTFSFGLLYSKRVALRCDTHFLEAGVLG